MSANVRKALLSAADTFLVAQGLTGLVQWPNRAFDPSGLEYWAAVQVVQNAPFVVTLGGRGSDRMTGFMQIDFCAGIGQGEAQFYAWEDAARAEFVAGKTYTFGGDIVHVVSAGMEGARFIDSWAKKSFIIEYRADLERAAI